MRFTSCKMKQLAGSELTNKKSFTQLAFTCSKLTIETEDQGMEYAQY